MLFFNGLFRSMQFTSLNTLAFADIPKPLLSPATSLYSMVTQMTMGMGVAVGAIFLRLGALLHPHASKAPVLADFRFAFILVSIVIALGTLDCLGLAPDAGAEVSGHRASPEHPRRSLERLKEGLYSWDILRRKSTLGLLDGFGVELFHLRFAVACAGYLGGRNDLLDRRNILWRKLDLERLRIRPTGRACERPSPE